MEENESVIPDFEDKNTPNSSNETSNMDEEGFLHEPLEELERASAIDSLADDSKGDDWENEFPEATKFFYIIAGLCAITFIIGIIAIVKAC